MKDLWNQWNYETPGTAKETTEPSHQIRMAGEKSFKSYSFKFEKNDQQVLTERELHILEETFFTTSASLERIKECSYSPAIPARLT